MARKGPQPGTVQNRKPHDTITEGNAVGVLLSNRPSRVWVHREDFTRIVQAHGNRTWAWVEAKQYVKLKVDQVVSVPVARLVVGGGGRFIRYADGDRLNLRRENLSTQDAMIRVERVKRKAIASARPRALPAKPLATPVVASPMHAPSAKPQKQALRAVATVKRKRPGYDPAPPSSSRE